MIERISSRKLISLSKQFKSVAVIGPRQSGKTTLVKSVFPNKPYVSLENPDYRTFALEDPRGFLNQYASGAILDEVQRTPLLFSYLQEILDNSTETGLFILTGSNNFLLQESISQSLAGRVAYIQLPPFSLVEIKHEIEQFHDNKLLFHGFYPPIYDQPIEPSEWYKNYIRTYIERDVRQIKNITDLIIFEKFMSILAGRVGQELNLSSISVEIGVDLKTIQSWLSILASSFIIHLLPSYHQNFNKVVVKRPKLYFYDCGLVCSLLKIQTQEMLEFHPLRGNLFENMVVSEMLKFKMTSNQPTGLYFWRDKAGHEIDLIDENSDSLNAIEIKSGQTIQSTFFKNLTYWSKLGSPTNSTILYSGIENQIRSNGINVINWRDFLLKMNQHSE